MLALQAEADLGPKYVAVVALIAVALSGFAVLYASYYDSVPAAATADP